MNQYPGVKMHTVEADNLDIIFILEKNLKKKAYWSIKHTLQKLIPCSNTSVKKLFCPENIFIVIELFDSNGISDRACP